ncbi:MAG: PQQ-binding-like beta-propeller repeat protein [Candidatus Firestonebacteria bacterium]
MNKKIISIMLVSMFLTAFLSAADYKAFKRDIKRSGAVTEQAYPVLTQKLVKSLGKAALSSPIVYKGLVFFGDSSGKVYAFDASGDNSTPVWQYATAGKIVSSMIADKEIVYVISQDGNLYALNYATGVLVFSYNIGSSDASSPAISGDFLYGSTGFPNKLVYCFSLISRTMVWTKNVGSYSYSSPVIGDGIVYVGVNNGRLYALDSATGDVKWYFQTLGDVLYSSACLSSDGNWVYFAPGNDDRKIYALNAKTGELKAGWVAVNFGTTPTVVSSITEENGVLYFVSGAAPATLYAVSATDGTQKWSRNIDNPSPTGILSSPVAVNGVIYVGSAANKLYAVNAADGVVIGSYTTLAPVLSSPAVANGKVNVCAGENGDGYFYIYQAAKVSAITYPEEGSTVTGAVTVKGVLVNSALTSYQLDYSFGNTNQWVRVSDGTTIPADGVVGTLNPRGMRPGEYSLRLTSTDGTALNSNGVIGMFVSYFAPPFTVSVAGGTYTDGAGLYVVFQAGSLNVNDTLTIAPPGTFDDVASRYPANCKNTANNIVKQFTLGNPTANATFNKPVTLRIPYLAVDVLGAVESNLRLAVWDATKNKWLVVNTSSVDKAAKEVIATVNHFSIYRIFEYTPVAGDVITAASVYAYPNPARGNDMVFKCYLGSDAEITVSVFNVAGEIVAKLTATGLAGNGVELPWNIKDYASGAYLFKLEAVTPTGEKKYVTKKFAIIH